MASAFTWQMLGGLVSIIELLMKAPEPQVDPITYATRSVKTDEYSCSRPVRIGDQIIDPYDARDKQFRPGPRRRAD
jgi:hypothetical protein